MATKVKKRRPLVAALLSLLFVGLGQIYAGRLRRGVVWQAIGFGIAWGIIFDLVPVDQLLWLSGGVWMVAIFAVFVVLFRIIVIIDAYRVARQAGVMTLRRYQRWYIYVAVCVVLVTPFLVVDVLYPNIVPLYSIPSGTMVPSLLVGDYAIAAKYHDRQPERGDVAIYFVPEAQVIYVKRIVGLPGDSVQMQAGQLYLNDELVPRERLDDVVVPDAPDAVVYRETLPGGASHLIMETGDSRPLDDTEPVTVPPDSYFVLGDNRDNSRDSRVMGSVSREYMQSRLMYLFWARDRSRIGLALE